jgi:uncharacterized membrane protein
MADQPSSSAVGGLDPKLASLLAYLCSPFTGLLFILLEKNDKTVRLHAWHSLVFGGACIVLSIVMSVISSIMLNISLMLYGAFNIVNLVISLGEFVLWIMLMVRAYQGSILNIPVITDLARKQAEK